MLLAVATPPCAARAQTDTSTRFAAATAEAVRIGRRDPAREAAARMTIAEQLMLTDPAAAATMVEAARAASVRAEGADGPMVALAEYRLALIRALGGDRAGQLRPMVEAAERVAARARTPEQRTLAGQALIVAASFAMSSGQPALTDRARDAGVAMLSRDDLAQTTDLAEAYRVVGDVCIFQNRPADALAWSDRAVALYERLDPADPALVFALARRGSAYQRLSRYPEALADLRRAVAQSDSATADPTVPIYALRALGNYYWRLAEPDLALPLFRRALVAAEKLPPGFPYAGGLSRDIMLTLLDADRPEDARAYAQDTAKRAHATMGPTSYEYASALLVLARIDIAEGVHDDAARRIDEAEAIFARGLSADNGRRFEPLAARGALLSAIGQGVAAASQYDRARDLLAHMPPDDAERIDMAEGAAAARLLGPRGSRDGWSAARAAADGLTIRIVRQVSGIGAIDTAKGRSDRVFGTALDTAWAQMGAGGVR
jgi:tetratricopeptide (TPR) repeat protein